MKKEPGYVYILTNPSFREDWVKIGKTLDIAKTGRIVIPCQWKGAGDFSEGLAPVKDANDKWFYIDKTGKVVKEYK